MLDEAREPSKVVADILQSEMELDDDHCLLGDQKWDIPTDRALFVAIFDDLPRPIGMSVKMDTSVDPPAEIQQIVCLHDIRIEIMSFDHSARIRKEEIGLALASFSAQQHMEKNNCQIGLIQPPLNASMTEETARLLKYVIHVNVTALHTKTKPGMPYFDKFNGARVDGTAKPPEVIENA